MSTRELLKRHLPYKARAVMKNLAYSAIEKINNLSGRYSYRSFVLYPKLMRDTIEKYNAAKSISQKENISWSILDKVTINPMYGNLLETQYFVVEFGNEELYLQALGAKKFQIGNFEDAVNVFKRLKEKNPSRLNYFLLSRAMRWANVEEAKIVSLLEEGLQYHKDNYLHIFALAASNFLAGKTQAANKLLDSIRFQVRDLIKKEHPLLDGMKKELAEALDNKLLERKVLKGYVPYTEENIRDLYWEDYFCEMMMQSKSQMGFGFVTWMHQENVGNMLLNIKPDIKTVIDFGVLCAHPDYNLSKRFPNVNFIGIDRETTTAKFNKKSFQNSNVEYMADDILKSLPGIMKKYPKPYLLFHARTVNLIYPEWAKQFYKKCAELGVDYLLIYENIGLSKTHFQYYDYDQMPEDSIVFQNGQFIHNYKKFLQEAGYKITDKKLIKGDQIFHIHDGLGIGECHVLITAKLK